MNKFEETVAKVPDIAGGYHQGLQALESRDLQYVSVSDSRSLDGSVAIDSCTKSKYPSGNRWDYVISYKERAYFMEVHPATNGSVIEMDAKLKWVKDWLKDKAPALDSYPSGNPRFTWVHSGRYGLLKSTSEYRKAAKLGLIPVKRLTLSDKA